MHKFAAILVACGLFLPSASLASDKVGAKATDLPPIVTAGMNAYKSGGPDEAVKTWIQGSPMEGSRDVLSEANILRQVQDFYGAYQSFDVISMRDLSPTARIIYVTMNYQKGPLFAKFVVYHSEKGWILTTFTFNTKEEAVLPDCP